MNVNELNKMNVIAQFSKLVSQTNFVSSGEGTFAGFLEKNTGEISSSLDNKNIEKDTKQNTTNDKAVENEKTDSKKDVSENKNDKSEEKKTNKKEDSLEKTDGEDNSKEKTQKKEKTKTSENTDKAVAYAEAQPTEQAQTQAQDSAVLEGDNQLSSDVINDILSGKISVMTAEGEVLSISELTSQQLADMPQLTLVDAQNMQKINIEGKSLAQQIAAMQQSANVEMGENIAASEMASLGQTTSTQKNANANIQESQTEKEVSDELVDGEILDSQLSAEEQLNNLMADKKIKIDLNVKEEKNSYFQNKNLVKDSFVAQELSDEAEISLAGKPAEQQTAGNVNSLPNSATSMSTAGVSQIAMADDGVNNQQIAVEVKQVSTNNTNAQNVISGAEFVASHKTEAADKNAQTSFRDVYKGMSKEVVEQVKVNITKSAVKGADTIEVRLKPEDLGHIEIKMQIKDGKLQAHIISSRPETMEALQKDAQVLEKAFNDAGFQTDGNSLSFSFRNEGNQAQGQNDQLRSFLGKVFEQEANSDDLVAEAVNQNWISENGLNIRV